MTEPKFQFSACDYGTERKRFVWALKGPSGGVHIWAQFMPKGSPTAFGERCYGGVEVHYPERPYDHMPEDAPIPQCWLTGKPCWPSGTSSFFSEQIAPMVEDYEDEPMMLSAYMEGVLLDFYANNLSRDDFAQPEPEFL